MEARNLGCRHASCNILPLDFVVGRVALCGPLVVVSLVPSFLWERDFGYTRCRILHDMVFDAQDGCVLEGLEFLLDQ